uniref:Vesicle transport protein n=1 Tax=Panagrellus redivivus TaxID=6233 RepID=A0A7E4V3V0_PANRE
MLGKIRSAVGSVSGSTSDLETQSSRNGATEPASNDIRDVNGWSWQVRVYSFVLAFFLSLICSFLATPLLLRSKFTGFAVMISLGAILSIISTCFLSGPIKQLKKMFDPTRLIATIVYISMIVCTLIAGLVYQNAPLTVVFTLAQYAAMAWYSLSYIPYAREMLLRCFGSCIEL